MKNWRICHGSPTPTDRGRTRPFPNEDAASHDQRASTLTNTATRRLAPRRRAHWLSVLRPSSDALRPSLPRSISYAFCLTAVASFLSCSRPVSACSLNAYACPLFTLPTDLRDGAATRRRGDAAPQRALSLALYIGQTFYPPRILRFGHFSSVTRRLDKKSCVKIIPLLLYYTILQVYYRYYTTSIFRISYYVL